MNRQEVELEELAEKVNQKTPYSVPPMFELYATLFSILISIMFFIYPDMLFRADGHPIKLFANMSRIMPQWAWALCFFVACMLKAIGLMFTINWMRIAGLVLSSLLYVSLAFCYAVDFPSIGAIVFSCMTMFTIISVPLVKHTTIRHKGGNSDED